MSHSQLPPVDPMADTMRLDVLSDTQPIRLPTLDPSAVQWFEAGDASAEAEWVDVPRRSLPWCALARLTVAIAGCAATVLLLAAAY